MNRPGFLRTRAGVAAECLLFFFLAWLEVRPLFKAKYLERWDSIESTFIADGRFLRDHWPHPQWQPLWYLGTRFDYVYPPALRYGTALLSRVWLPVKAYHIYTAFFYCVGIAGVFFFVRAVSGSPGSARLAAAASALLSPSFLFLPDIRRDADLWTPMRLWTLLRYGEGPHMTALALLPIALGCVYLGLERNRPASLALGAVFCALVVSNNFYGATALALFFPLLVWGVWVARQDLSIWARAAAIVLLAYGLTAFWLTPSYLRITAANLHLVAPAGKPWCVAVAAAVFLVFLMLSYRLARGKKDSTYPVLVCGILLFLSLIVLGYYWAGFQVVGVPGRLIPELDLAMILAAAEGLRRLWLRGGWRRLPAAAITLAAFATAVPFLSQNRVFYRPDSHFDQRAEYRMQDWVARNLPGARTMVTGSNRFWFNVWHDLQQLGGGSEQGLLNPVALAAQWEIQLGPEPELAVHWMLCLGVDAVIVPQKNSQEVYHDFLYPQKFAGVLPVAYDDGAGNLIYRVPRRYPGLARVVDRARFAALPPVRSQVDLEGVRAYARAVEQGPDEPASTAWRGTDELVVHARMAPGQAVLVQESYDPAWHAYAGGRPLPVRKDQLGLMLIDAPPGEQDLRLVFELPLENLVGRILTALSAAAVLLLLSMRYWRK